MKDILRFVIENQFAIHILFLDILAKFIKLFKIAVNVSSTCMNIKLSFKPALKERSDRLRIELLIAT